MYWTNQILPHPETIASMVNMGALKSDIPTVDALWRAVYYPQSILGDGDATTWLQESIHRLYYGLIAFR